MLCPQVDFAALATRESHCSSAQRGGDLGSFGWVTGSEPLGAGGGRGCVGSGAIASSATLRSHCRASLSHWQPVFCSAHIQLVRSCPESVSVPFARPAVLLLWLLVRRQLLHDCLAVGAQAAAKRLHALCCAQAWPDAEGLRRRDVCSRRGGAVGPCLQRQWRAPHPAHSLGDCQVNSSLQALLQAGPLCTGHMVGAG